MYKNATRPLSILAALVLLAMLCGCASAGSQSSSVTSPVSDGLTATPTVSILSPQPNATVTGPFRVQATVSDSTNLMLHLLLDGTEVFSNQASAIDTTISAADGPHRLTVQARSTTGQITAADVNFVASSAITNPPPTFSVVADHLEEQSDWQTCGNCGNTGGAVGNTATYLMERGITLPATDGSSARFSIGGPYPYANGYWWEKHTAPAARINQLRYEFDLYVPIESASAPQAIEFECQQQIDGYIYNFAFQADYSSKTWRVFDYVNRAWNPTTVPLTLLTAGAWHHIIADYHTADAVVYHDSLTIDGTIYPVNLTHAAKFVGGTSRQFTNAFQLDLNKIPTPFAVYVDAMKVSYN